MDLLELITKHSRSAEEAILGVSGFVASEEERRERIGARLEILAILERAWKWPRKHQSA